MKVSVYRVVEKVTDKSKRTDAEIRMKGMEALLSELGDVDAEVFIKMILREPFDYTKWQKHLWQDLTVDELARRAAELEKGS